MKSGVSNLLWTVGADRQATPPSAPKDALSFLRDNPTFLQSGRETAAKLADCFTATCLNEGFQSDACKTTLAVFITQFLTPENVLSRLKWAIEHNNSRLTVTTLLFLYEVIKKPGVKIGGYKDEPTNSPASNLCDALITFYAYSVKLKEKEDCKVLKVTPVGSNWSDTVNSALSTISQHVPVRFSALGPIQGDAMITALPNSLHGLTLNTQDITTLPEDNALKDVRAYLQNEILTLTLPEATSCTLRWMDNITTLIAPKLETLILEDCPKLTDLQIPSSCTITHEISP